jgi:hypothetical protein
MMLHYPDFESGDIVLFQRADSFVELRPVFVIEVLGREFLGRFGKSPECLLQELFSLGMKIGYSFFMRCF